MTNTPPKNTPNFLCLPTELILAIKREAQAKNISVVELIEQMLLRCAEQSTLTTTDDQRRELQRLIKRITTLEKHRRNDSQRIEDLTDTCVRLSEVSVEHCCYLADEMG